MRTNNYRTIAIGAILILGVILAFIALLYKAAASQFVSTAGSLICPIIALGLYLEEAPNEPTDEE